MHVNSRTLILVDGSNVAYAELSENGDPKVSNLVGMRKHLRQKGYKPLIIIDASLRYEIDDPQQLESLIDDQIVRQAPADTDADFFILEEAQNENARVVSNDEFEEYQEDYPGVKSWRLPFMILNGEITLYEEEVE